MYECPNECGSTTFVQTIEQGEIVKVDDAGEPEAFEPVGGTVARDVECEKCGAEVEA